MSEMHGPYEDQLSAARYKAERDQARQELDRMRPAFEWVEEHGGLERIKAQRRESIPRAAYERKKAGFLGHIAECERALGRRRDAITRLANENDTLRLERAQMRPRLMPEGMEWDGSVLRIRTAENVDYDGETLFVLIGGRDE